MTRDPVLIKSNMDYSLTSLPIGGLVEIGMTDGGELLYPKQQTF